MCQEDLFKEHFLNNQHKSKISIYQSLSSISS